MSLIFENDLSDDHLKQINRFTRSPLTLEQTRAILAWVRFKRWHHSLLTPKQA
jgi:hypothetical protein